MSVSSKTRNSKILVLGGTGEIGAAICEKALSSGRSLVFTYNSGKAKSEKMMKVWQKKFPNAEIESRKIDFEKVDSDDLQDFFTGQEFQAAVFASGLYSQSLLAQQEEKDWENMFRVNLFGPFLVVRELISVFLRRKGGHFVFVSSIASQGASGLAPYGASKAALNSLSRSLAAEWGPRGISSVSLNLGIISTEAVKEFAKGNDGFANWKKRNPIRRFVEPAEVAHWALQFCGPEALATNGAVLEVSGGLSCLT